MVTIITGRLQCRSDKPRGVWSFMFVLVHANVVSTSFHGHFGRLINARGYSTSRQTTAVPPNVNLDLFSLSALSYTQPFTRQWQQLFVMHTYILCFGFICRI